MDLEDDSVLADATAPPFLAARARELFDSCRPRVALEVMERADDASLDLGRELGELTASRWGR